MAQTEAEQVYQAEQETVKEISLRKRFFNIQTLISFVVAVAIILFVVTRLNVDFASIWSSISQSNPYLYLLALASYYASFVLRGIRWRALLKNVGFHKSMGVRLPSVAGLSEIILLSWFVNCIIPARLGDAYRAYVLKRNADVSFSTTIGTVFAERVFDMGVLFVLLAIAALGVLGGVYSGTALGVVEIGFGLTLVLMIMIGVMIRFRQTILRFVPQRFRPAYHRFEAGTLGSFRQIPLIVFISILVWMLETGRLLFVVQSLGLSVALPLILFVALAHSMITVIPFTPGGLGLAEAGIVGLLLLGTVDREAAVSIAIVDRTISYWSIVVFGLILFILTRKK